MGNNFFHFNFHSEKWVKFIRAREWWDSKIPIALGTAYALAWHQNIPLTTLWYPLLLLVSAGIMSAIFASVFNDLLDQDEDARAGKVTGIMELSSRGKNLALVSIELGMLMIAVLLTRYPVAFTIFLVIWFLYTAYSLPPIRLKERDVWGVLCIATGEHLLASLLAVALVREAGGKSLPLVWGMLLIVWCLMLGCRSILWHQLCDYDNDRRTGTRTMGGRYDFAVLQKLVEKHLFPVELASFVGLLALSWNSFAWTLLMGYCVLEWWRYRYLDTNPVIVAPQPNPRFVLLEFYQLFFPLAYLVASIGQEPLVILYIAAHLLLFPAPVRVIQEHLQHLFEWRFWPYLSTRADVPPVQTAEPVNYEVAPSDPLYNAQPEFYFQWGAEAIRRIQITLAKAGKRDVNTILCFPCNYGRELRFLRANFPNARLVACDEDVLAVDFCGQTFDAIKLYAGKTATEMPLYETFDLIWVGSFFTNLPAEQWSEYLQRFGEHLKPDGVLLFTFYGEVVADELRSGTTGHLSDAEEIQQVLDGYDREGFGYVPYPGVEARGFACASPAFVTQWVAEVPSLRLFDFVERGWFNYQDTVACFSTAVETSLKKEQTLQKSEPTASLGTEEANQTQQTVVTPVVVEEQFLSEEQARGTAEASLSMPSFQTEWDTMQLPEERLPYADQVSLAISPDDLFYKIDPTHYFHWGASALHRVLLTLNTFEKSEIRNILILESGYGREVRFFKAAFPDARIVVADTDGEAVNFCVETFGVAGVYADREATNIPLRERFDLVWTGLWLHRLNAERCHTSLTFLSKRLNPGGILLLTVHGTHIVDELRSGTTGHLTNPEDIQQVLDGYDRNGYGYVNYPNEDYGFACVSPDWILAALKEKPSLRLLESVAQGWSHYEDTYACFRPAETGENSPESAKLPQVVLTKPINRVISPRDLMHDTNANDYFAWGIEAVRQIQTALIRLEKSEVKSLLDLPCGHGRELRFLVSAFPDTRIVACDIDPDCVDFCVANFGVPGVYSKKHPAEIPLTETFDVIWVGSLLTHIDQNYWREFLHFFADHLNPGGVLIFTTLGDSFAERLRSEQSDKVVYKEMQDRVTTILAGYEATGFGYADYVPVNNEVLEDYGLSCASPEWVKNLVAEFPALELRDYTVRGWFDFQDVVVLVN